MVVFIVYIILAYLLKNKERKTLQQTEINCTHAFNITFIGFLIIQLNNLREQNKKKALLKGPGNKLKM